MTDDCPVQCTRCRNQHNESERVGRPDPKFRSLTNMVCPRCGCRNYYDMTPYVAWCWASGLIEFGETVPEDAIVVARGPKAHLVGAVTAVARHGYGESKGLLLVPGIPEADTQQAKGDALARFLAWCNKRRRKDGVVFNSEKEAA